MNRNTKKLSKLTILLSILLTIGAGCSMNETPEEPSDSSSSAEATSEESGAASASSSESSETEGNVPPVNSEHYLNRESLFETLSLDKDSVVFVGDSIVQRNEWAELFDNIDYVNRGIDNDTILGVLDRIDTIAQDKPKQIFLMVGINDLIQATGNQDELVEQYQQIIDTISETSPETVISVVSLLPVNKSGYNHMADNNAVQEFNGRLQTLSEENELEYVDTFSTLYDEDNNELYAKYTNDGIHLTGEAYRIMKDALEPFIK